MRNLSTFALIFIALVSAGLVPRVSAAQSVAVAPTLIPINGELRTPEAQPRTGTVLLVISLYEGEHDPAPRWIEHQQVTLDLAGRYSVHFGGTRTDGLPADLFTGEAATRWIGVAVEGEPEQPRVMLVSVPYAAKAASADTLAGKPVSDFVLASTFREDLRTVLEEEGVAAVASDNNTDVKPLATFNEDVTVNGVLTVTPAAATFSRLQLSNDQGPNVGALYAFNSNYPSSGPYVANGFTFDGGSAGGLSLAASHSQGAIRFYAGSNNIGMRLDNPGVLSVYGFGNHLFQGAGNGVNSVTIQNVDNGSGNYSALRLGNDQASNVGALYAFASSFNTSGPYVANGFTFDGGSSGGLSVAASHSQGTLRFYAGSNNERMRIDKDGRIGIGTSSPQALLHVVGTSRLSGDVTVDGNIAAKYQDVAEWVDSVEPLEPGSLVIIDSTATNRVTAARTAYDARVAGAVSPQPGLILGEPGPGRVLVAQSGRVKVKADARNGAIRPGDLLVSSPTKGHVMRSRPVTIGDQLVHRPGTVVGKALEALPKGRGEILVLLTLQ